MNIAGIRAIITGGASGLGEATARMLVDSGARVFVLDLPTSAGADLEAELSPHFTFLPTDVTSDDQVTAAFATIEQAAEPIMLCLNSAGNGPGHRIVRHDGTMFPLDLYRRTIELNLVGAFNVLRNAARLMTRNDPGPDGERGLIVNVASIAGIDGQVGQAAYSASKGGLIASTLPLARDLADWGIRVMTIAPGIIETSLLRDTPPKVRDAVSQLAVFPKRLGQPREFAALVRHLAENPFLNGEVIRFDAAARLPPR